MNRRKGDLAMSAPRLLIVEDEPDNRELLSAALRFAGFQVTAAADGPQALAHARRERPDLVLLDVMLPGPHGFDVVRRLRAEGVRVPVLFLSVRDGTGDKVTGPRPYLSRPPSPQDPRPLGGGDYVTKPFSLSELVARIEALLRRCGGPSPAGTQSGRLSFADIELDEQSHDVYKAGARVALSATELKLLRYFLTNPARVLSKRQILNHVWEYGLGPDTNAVESCVSYLRKKVDTSVPRLIHTVRGVGYVLRLPPA